MTYQSDPWLSHIEERLEKLEARINVLFGALGILTVVANIGIAVVIGAIVGGRPP